MVATRGELEILGERHQHFVERLLLREAVILDLDVERSRFEEILQCAEHLPPGVGSLLENRLGHETGHAGRQPDEALPVFRKQLQIDARGASARPFDPASTHQPDEVSVPLLASGEQKKVVSASGGGVAARSLDDVDLAADDRLQPSRRAGAMELDGAEHVAVVGHGHRGHA